MFVRAAGLVLLLAAPLLPAAARAADKVAIFPVELHDPALAYGRKAPPDDVRRLALVTEELRRMLAERGGVEVVDIAPQAEEIRKQAPLYKCDDCTVPIAKALGADLAVTAFAEKGANQLFNLKVFLHDVATGKLVRGGQVVIRANADNDWAHAMRWVVKNRLLSEPLPSRS